ncbi:MAG: 5-oxoprolinase subunit PxpA [Candidatus Thermoplasmatota archaeon]|nr:5-oxoprolinase subunit PxpA [Candidatus Thermoplasmatota archaeon]
MKHVDLNSDVGESFGVYKIGADEEVLKHVTSANIACGFHAGDPLVMERTIELAVKNSVAVGAHPGYPDLMGFGRREMKASNEEVRAYVKYQLGALSAFATAKGVKVQHVKAHGAMYNMAAVDYNTARTIAEAIYEVDRELILLALAGSEMVKAAKDTGLKVAEEVFADRAYNEDGTLVQRGKQGAMIEDENLAIGRVIVMVKEGKVKAITGKEIRIRADSICVHGDSPKAIAFVKRIREGLRGAGIKVTPMKEFIK